MGELRPMEPEQDPGGRFNARKNNHKESEYE